MKSICVIVTFVIISFGTLEAQNLFFLGNKSYFSTSPFKLKSNMGSAHNDIDILIAKDGLNGLIAVSIYSMTGVLIRGKLIIYLDDGSIITCIDRGIYDYVDDIATTVYYLTNSELKRMMRSNINTIRYTLRCRDCSYSSEEGNFSASNKENGFYERKEKTDFTLVISNLFND